MIDASRSKEITARKLIYFRRAKRLSQSQAAKKIGISRSRYANFESSRSIIPYHIIRDICNAYQISLSEFENQKISV